MAKKEGIRRLFDKIAPDYDRLNHILSLNIDKGWRRKAVRQIADCEALPYEDNSFDRISVGFGVRNFEHLDIGLKEMFRVLRPEGKLVILELSVPSNAVVRWFYKLYFLKILPAVGGLVSGDRGAYEYLPASVLRFPAPEEFIRMMKSAGFDIVTHTPFTLGICRMYVGTKSSISFVSP